MAEKTIKIGSRLVGKNQPVFIIAEAGVNHNGRLDYALKLAEEAAKAGADAIKFQTFKAENLVIPSPERTMLKELELKESFYQPLIKKCREKKIIFLSTAHGGFSDIDFLNKLKIAAFKFGSGDLTNLPVLKYAAKFKKPLILGTGMANLKEIKEAVETIEKAGNQKIILLHCTTNYPCPIEEVNLKAMQTMAGCFPKQLIGYSDHTLGLETSFLATGLGAVIIEKHFTLNKKLKGPDHSMSLEPKELTLMIKAIRKAAVILGNQEKKPTTSEKKIMAVCRKSLVAEKDIEKGEKFTKNNLAIKRPGLGLKPKLYFDLLGKKAKGNIKANQLIGKNDYA